jgi:hypothetical protein
LAQRTTSVDLYDEKTKFYAPLFVNDTGCEPITISAHLSGKSVSGRPVTRDIQFHCGE